MGRIYTDEQHAALDAIAERHDGEQIVTTRYADRAEVVTDGAVYHVRRDGRVLDFGGAR